MMSNNWQSPSNQSGSTGNRAEHSPRKAGLLSSYARQQQQPLAASAPLASNNNAIPGGPPPSSPLPPTFGQSRGQSSVAQGPPPYSPMGQPTQQLLPQQQWNGPSFMARPVQMLQRLSDKMNAIRRPGPQVDQNPLVRYHGTQTPTNAATANGAVPGQVKPWRRSRTRRIIHLKLRRIERNRHNGPTSRRIRTATLSLIAAIVLMLLTSGAGYAYNFYQSALPQVQNLANLQIPQSTRIYDRDGTLLYTLYANGKWGDGGRSTPISFDYLPEVLQNAQIAAEDPTFWENDGTDLQGMLRALQQYISAGGQVKSGGSTMTQQLIKNLTGDTEDTPQRKASEAALAIALTQTYPKWKIMEMYFNVTPYGAQEKGIEAAVEDYFGLMPQCNLQHQCTPGLAFLNSDLTKCKNPKDETTCAQDPTGMLGLARSVLLAGIPQNPTHFDPTVSHDNFLNVLQNRVPYVLQQMIANNMQIDLALGFGHHYVGLITPAMATQVEKMISGWSNTFTGFQHTMLAPHFVQWVIDTLSTSLGNGNYNVGLDILEKSGFNIYTTLDLNMEQFVEKDVKHNLDDDICQPYTGCAALNTAYNVNDSAVVVENAKSGEVLAMDGSADFTSTAPAIAGQVNVALSYRQPGSSIKPILYAAALEKGWYPDIRILDNKTYFPTSAVPSMQPVSPTTTYVPTDYLGTYHPQYTDTNMLIDLDNSFNIPAIKALLFAGVDSVVDMARRVGVTAIDDDVAAYNALHPTAPNDAEQLFGPSMALGTPGIPLIQMVGAYQTFADNGVHVPYHNILDIWDNYGHDLYHYNPAHPNSAQAISPQIDFLLSNMLSDNDARYHEFQGLDTLTMDNWNPRLQVAAKTGTTDAFVDNWTLGYTSNAVVGVWSGNADGDKDPMGHVIGISGAGPIWQDVIEYVTGRSERLETNGPIYKPDLILAANPFPQPGGVVQATVNAANGLEVAPGVSTFTGWMLNGEQPQQTGLPTCSDSGNSDNGSNDSLTCPSNDSGNPGTGNSSDNNGNQNNGSSDWSDPAGNYLPWYLPGYGSDGDGNDPSGN